MFTLATCSYPEFKRSMGEPVQISLGLPKWWAEPPHHRVWAITPRRTYLGMDEEPYREAYIAQLETYGKNAIMREFEKIAAVAPSEQLVLLCFENMSKPGNWCHRSMFARWWKHQTGMDVTELGRRSTIVDGVETTPTLF